jgi:O-antigen ligase
MTFRINKNEKLMLEIIRKSKYDIIRVGIVLIMMLTTVTNIELRWMKCEVWILYGIPALLLMGFAISVLRKQRFRLTLADAIAATWFVYFVGRTWIGNEWPCRMEFLKTVETFLLYVGLRCAFDRTRMSAWVLIGVILTFGCYEAYLGFSQMYGDDVSRHGLFALTGNFLNPGPYSAYLMIGVVIGLSALKNMQNQPIVNDIQNILFVKKILRRIPERIKGVVRNVKSITWRHIVTIAVIIMAIMLPATMSRAAFLGVAVVVLLIYRGRYWKYRYIVWGTIAFVGVAFYFFKQGSADGRMIIWKATLTTWVDVPWFGIGIGGFLHAVAEGIARLSTTNTDLSSAGVADYAYNILLKIVVEQGVVGGALAVAFVLVTLTKLSRNSSALFWGIVSLLVFGMFSYPFDMLSYKVVAVLIVAWSESTIKRQKDERQMTNCERRMAKNESQLVLELGWIKASLLSCFLGFASWHAGKLSGVCFQTEWDSYMPLSVNSFSIEDGYKWQPSVSDYSHFLYVFGKKLREEGQYNASNAIAYQATKCSADPAFYILIGNNYKDMKHYDFAEQAYYKAFAVMPNRLYPLYQLMLLYQESGEIQKRKLMAKRVIGMKPKIESPATRDMKKKAMVFL